MDLSTDEIKFITFWLVVFGSGIGFWVVVVHWIWKLTVA
jgi:hypothetical protein